jgi:S-adenosylmethionine:tRNA ribosyltransferase-isomerase
MKKEINIKDYTYLLPGDRIALHPLARRDQSKLLVFRNGTITHERFFSLHQHIPSNSVLYFNNTKVIQARLNFEKETGAAIEVFLLSPSYPSTLLLEAMQSRGRCRWKCTIGNLKRWKEGTTLFKTLLSTTLKSSLIDREEGLVEFSWDGEITFGEIISEAGDTPLPPYLKRSPVPQDRTRYQTIYSEEEGAVAAPTAGLHFTPEVFASLQEKGIKSEFVTLHVSAGTFQPVKTENAAAHHMHKEQVVVSQRNVESLLERGQFIIPVGTTSLRTLESLYWYGVKLSENKNAPFVIQQHDAGSLPQDVTVEDSLRRVLGHMKKNNNETLVGETSIYIMPGYRFRVCQGLITNFHQPGSTLILLIAAFIGDKWRQVYHEALQNDYRFLSYGDSSILLP